VYLPGVAGNYLSVPDENALDITGDIDVRVRANLGSPLAANNFWAAKSSVGSGQYSWRLYSDTGGYPVLATSINGTSESFAVADAVPAYSSTLWIRATRASSTGQVLFYTSSDGASWTQLGAAKSTTPGALFANSVNAIVGGWDANNFNTAGAYYRAQVLNGINGSTVLDVDTSVLTSGSATSFTAKTGQTVTINRSTSGRKAVAVVSSPLWLLGSDDYMDVPDNDLLDFGANDSFTLLALVRRWNTTDYDVIVSKGTQGPYAVGYTIRGVQGSAIFSTLCNDGSTQWGTDALSPTYTAGSSFLATGVLDRSNSKIYSYINTNSNLTSLSWANLSNSISFQVGGSSGNHYAEIELAGAALFRRALTQAEITTISNYYTARVK